MVHEKLRKYSNDNDDLIHEICLLRVFQSIAIRRPPFPIHVTFEQLGILSGVFHCERHTSKADSLSQ